MRRYLCKIIWMLSFFCLIVSDQNAKQLVNYDHLHLITPITQIINDGTLILSNSPESVRETGILYQDQLIGKTRIVYHHVNACKERNRQLVIWLENEEATDCYVTFGARAHHGPNKFYLQTGCEALIDYFFSLHQKSLLIEPMEKQVIYSSPVTGWQTGTVLTGIIDVDVKQKLTLHIAVKEIEKKIDEIDTTKVLEKSNEERGKFGTLTIKQHVILPEEGTFYYVIEPDKWHYLKGKDQTTGKAVMNYGNYGILYKILVYASSETEMFISPRGGIFEGVIRCETNQLIPIVRTHVFKTKKEMIPIAHLKAGSCETFEYMLPNGSAAPVLIGFRMEKKGQ